jgi:hypothetical protein
MPLVGDRGAQGAAMHSFGSPAWTSEAIGSPPRYRPRARLEVHSTTILEILT